MPYSLARGVGWDEAGRGTLESALQGRGLLCRLVQIFQGGTSFCLPQLTLVRLLDLLHDLMIRRVQLPARGVL